jgi:FtsH-binding integral membrane protein
MSVYRVRDDGWSVAQASQTDRVEFIHKTYQHLALALASFVGIEAALLHLPGIESLAYAMLNAWFLVLGAFMLVSWIAEKWAASAVSLGKQYAGLALYVVAEAIIFVPLMFIATLYDPGAIAKAGVATGIVFAGLTLFVLISKKDFSFMRGILAVVGFGALALIVISLLFGMALGTWFSVAMVVFAGGAVLYHTSNVLHRYRPGQHVAASLALFASVALMLWYMVQLFTSRR